MAIITTVKDTIMSLIEMGNLVEAVTVAKKINKPIKNELLQHIINAALKSSNLDFAFSAAKEITQNQSLKDQCLTQIFNKTTREQLPLAQKIVKCIQNNNLKRTCSEKLTQIKPPPSPSSKQEATQAQIDKEDSDADWEKLSNDSYAFPEEN